MKEKSKELLAVFILGTIMGVFRVYKERKNIKKILKDFKFKSEYPESTSISRYNLDK